MTKAEALHIAMTAIMREILREDDAQTPGSVVGEYPNPPAGPMPQFDFDASDETCEHNGVYIDRSLCPIHGPHAQTEVTPEELDDITSDEPSAPVLRARRLAEQNARRARQEKAYPEDLPMSGLAPPDPIP